MDFEAPREILQSFPELELLEMTKTRKKSPCCGSGGGAVMTDSANKNARNVVQQASETSATLLITSCPYCRENLRNAGGMAVEDIAELLIRLNRKIEFDQL
jgi:Fe-S oxidoreductase